MKSARTVLLAGLLLIAAGLPGHCLRVAVVQFRIDESTYASLGSFRASVTAAVQEALQEPRPDLVVFPEYTAVFLALLPYTGELRGAASVADGLSKVAAAHPGIGGMRDAFLGQSSAVQAIVADVFGGLARRHGIAIIAGSAFVRREAGDGTAQLRNRAFVFGSDGRLVYTQDKVYLTDFETDVVGLSPGSLADAAPFDVAGARIGLTLCRDTFFSDWEDAFRGRVDLWIDIKASGVPFTAEEQEDFQDALPARLPGAGVPHGITTCLVGRYLDLLWEGESSVIECVGGAARAVSTASSPRGLEVLRAEIDLVTGGGR